jgi:diguanylate cyclase (GGDEF)-like protein/PAS domain S-box-containing protein
MQLILEGAASRVQEEQERIESILFALGQGLFGLDATGCVQFLNSAGERMLGWPEAQLQGIPLHDLLHPVETRASPCTEETCPLKGVVLHADSRRVEHDTFLRRDGAVLPVSYTCTPVLRSGVQIGALICFDDMTERLAASRAMDEYARQVNAQNEQLLGYCQELTETQQLLERQAEELRHKNAQILEANLLLKGLATTDCMTGLANHRAFQEEIRAVWQSRRKKSGDRFVSLMLVDVDSFKAYNDSFGHPAGDEVLKTVGRLLRENMRESDMVARYGGEEFVIIAWKMEHGDALRSADRVRQIIEQFPFPNRKVTVSIGVATHDNRRAAQEIERNYYGTPGDLIKAADDALYQAKRSGRNCVAAAALPRLAA